MKRRMNENEQYELDRFMDAHDGEFDVAFQESLGGQKHSHWMCAPSKEGRRSVQASSKLGEQPMDSKSREIQTM